MPSTAMRRVSFKIAAMPSRDSTRLSCQSAMTLVYLDCATGWHLRSATLRPACKESSCMEPTRLPQVPHGPRFGDGVRQEPTMERRIFMALVSGGLLAAPLAAEAQQDPKVRRIAVLRVTFPAYVEARKEGLRRL